MKSVLGVRAINCLRNELDNLGEDPGYGKVPNPKRVAKFSAKELLSCPNFGERSLAEVVVWLEQYGLTLKGLDELKAHDRCECCGQVLPGTATVKSVVMKNLARHLVTVRKEHQC